MKNKRTKGRQIQSNEESRQKNAKVAVDVRAVGIENKAWTGTNTTPASILFFL